VNTGYIVGGGGLILKTTNGGTNWVQQISETSVSLHSVYFTDSITGYAVGDGGTILKTINGGSVGINEEQNENWEINIFPNPFEAKVKIEIPETKKCEAKVFDIFGKEVYSKVINKTEELDLKFLNSGVYIVMVNLGNKGIFYKKMIKK
jgi:hypothetical protein